MHNNHRSLAWFALRVRGTAAQFVADHLSKRGFECFMPTAFPDSFLLERLKEPDNPVRASYVLCRFDIRKKLPMLMTPGVLGWVTVDGAAAPIEDEEISSLRNGLEATVREGSGIPNPAVR